MTSGRMLTHLTAVFQTHSSGLDLTARCKQQSAGKPTLKPNRPTLISAGITELPGPECHPLPRSLHSHAVNGSCFGVTEFLTPRALDKCQLLAPGMTPSSHVTPVSLSSSPEGALLSPPDFRSLSPSPPRWPGGAFGTVWRALVQTFLQHQLCSLADKPHLALLTSTCRRSQAEPS